MDGAHGRVMRIVLPLLVAVTSAGACADLSMSGNTNSSTPQNLTAPVVPVPMVFSPVDAEAAVFEDDDLNIDVIQVYAYEDSMGSGIFLQFPAALAAAAGSYPLDPSADPAIKGWFATSDDHGEWDLRWQFALHHATLVVLTAGTSEGATIAIAVSSGAFVFENEDGLQNTAVTALVGGVNPAITAELDDDPILGCGDLD